MAKKKAAPTPDHPELEVSKPLVPDESWTFRHNDEPVTFEQVKILQAEHKKWVEEWERQEELKEETAPKKKKAKK